MLKHFYQKKQFKKEKIIKQASIKHISLINACFIYISKCFKKFFSKLILNFNYNFIT